MPLPSEMIIAIVLGCILGVPTLAMSMMTWLEARRARIGGLNARIGKSYLNHHFFQPDSLIQRIRPPRTSRRRCRIAATHLRPRTPATIVNIIQRHHYPPISDLEPSSATVQDGAAAAAEEEEEPRSSGTDVLATEPM